MMKRQFGRRSKSKMVQKIYETNCFIRFFKKSLKEIVLICKFLQSCAWSPFLHSMYRNDQTYSLGGTFDLHLMCPMSRQKFPHFLNTFFWKTQNSYRNIRNPFNCMQDPNLIEINTITVSLESSWTLKM